MRDDRMSRDVTVFYQDDESTPLAELRDRLGLVEGEPTTVQTMTAVVMLLCDRLDAALARIAELETARDAMAEQLESRRRPRQERANAQDRRRSRDERDAEREPPR